ncbi:MAG: hypothetical protein ACJAYC_000284 [Halieaceae bacterium]|jgi:hypothetical protein
MSDPELIDIQDIAPAEVAEVDPYQHREKIYTRNIEGFFSTTSSLHRLALTARLSAATLAQLGRPSGNIV